MGGAHTRSSENRWTLGSKVVEWQPRTGKCSVGRPPTRWTDYIIRPRIVEFGTPHKRPMSSSGRQSVDLMNLMTMYQLAAFCIRE
ncbi:jg17166 [Pararge aegeria aegeria]|uniref:Jg17166 protein n=1 Tax=Pararge aegeria aegeria TaxID=348720 RepID=A0A8S4RMW5_9NEOP|nr:jg17166 [Pararge aegeria aegeria]